MRIEFQVDGKVAVFSRNWLNGAVELRCGDRVDVLLPPLRYEEPLTLRPTQLWRRSVGRHVVRMERWRPWLMGALLPNSYRVFVDDKLVAKVIGY